MTLREQLQAIYDEQGKLTPALLVTVAREEGHPLHDRFEWDDAVAGEAYRRSQAHDLIQSVRIVFRPADDKRPEKSIRAWHAVRADPEAGNGGFAYVPADEVARDPLLAEMLLRDMRREWAQLKRRYEDFHEFWELVRADAA